MITEQELKAAAKELGMVVSKPVTTTTKKSAVSDLATTAEVSAHYVTPAIGHDESVVKSIRYNMGSGNSLKNNVVQFDIANTNAAAVEEIVRIGSRLGMADAYIRYNTTKSAVDSVTGILDNFGVNVQKCQGFSEIVSDTPVFIKTIKVISASTTQLNKQFQHKTILPDFTIIPLVQNIAFTREKSDQASDLNVAYGAWLLSSRNFLEFTSVAGTSVSLIMEVASVADVRSFVQF